MRITPYDEHTCPLAALSFVHSGAHALSLSLWHTVQRTVILCALRRSVNFKDKSVPVNILSLNSGKVTAVRTEHRNTL